MLDSVYNAKILEYAGNIARTGTLQNPDASAKAHSKLCGSTVEVDLKTKYLADDLEVTDFAQRVKACALGQASASIMAKLIVGKTHSELSALRNSMIAMLKEGAAAPAGEFEEFKFLEPVKDYKARHASTMLVFDAVVDALDQIAANRARKRKNKKKVLTKASNELTKSGIVFRVRK